MTKLVILAPPSFVSGVSHVGLQLFLAENIVDNPTIQALNTALNVLDSRLKTVTITTIHSESVA